MGFRVRRSVFPLDFTGTQFEGLEVIMKRPSIGALGDISQLHGINPENLSKEDILRIARTIEHFSECLVKWNMELEEIDEATNEPTGAVIPVAPNKEGIELVEDYLILQIVLVWLKVLLGDDVEKAEIPSEELAGTD